MNKIIYIIYLNDQINININLKKNEEYEIVAEATTPSLASRGHNTKPRHILGTKH